MKVYFFGVKSSSEKGHYLYDINCQVVWGEKEQHKIPFRYSILDSGLLPPGKIEEQGKLHLANINGWTILGMWDRSADTRGNCNASFIAEGYFSIGEMSEIAKENFPKLWERIQGK